MTKEKDWQAFCKIMDVAAELTNCPRKGEQSLVMYFEALKKYDFAVVARALSRHIENNNFFPSLAAFNQLIVGNVSEKAGFAFVRMMDAAQKHGKYASVKFGDPRIHYAIARIGGWTKVCNSTIEERKWFEAEFRKAYEEAAIAEISWGHFDVPDVIAGIIEVENKLQGRAFDPPKLIDCGRSNIQFPDPNMLSLEDKQKLNAQQEIAKMMKKIVKDFDGKNKGGNGK